MLIKVTMKPFHKQVGGLDCAVFAIAVVTALVFKGALYSSYKASQNIVCFALKEILWSLN